MATKAKGDPFTEGEAPDMKERKWPPGVEAILRKLRNKREWAKTKLSDSIADRDAYRTELREMGKERSKERLSRACDLFEALETIDYCRFVIKQCADRTDKVIGDAEQGKLFPEDDADIPSQQMWLKETLAHAKKGEKPEGDPDAVGAEK